MQRLTAPFCLFLGLALLVTAFGLLATDNPEPSVQLHQARVEGDDAMTEVLEDDLQQQIWIRRGMITALFAGAVIMGITAFYSMPASRR